MIRTCHQRRGYTLLELMAVMAALLVIGVMILPTLSGIRGNTNLKAGSDLIRGMLAEARAKAIEDGKNYRLSLSAEGTSVRIEPDVNTITGDPMMPDADEQPVIREEAFPKGVTAAILVDDVPVTDAAGWQRVATLLPDGTCREDNVFVQLSETGNSPITLRIRGLTGSSTQVNLPVDPTTGSMP